MKRTRKQRALRERVEARQRVRETAHAEKAPEDGDEHAPTDALDLLVARSVLGYDA